MNPFYFWTVQHPVWAAIGLFLSLYILCQLGFPGFLYYPEGAGLRSFGVGYRNKTILPLWLLTIVLAIVSYFFVICYIRYY